MQAGKENKSLIDTNIRSMCKILNVLCPIRNLGQIVEYKINTQKWRITNAVRKSNIKEDLQNQQNWSYLKIHLKINPVNGGTSI